MSASLADDVRPDAAGNSKLRLWLKSASYTRQLLLGEAGDPWLSAAQYLVYFNQAQGLLRPDVAVIDVGDLYQSWVGRHPALRAEMVSKRRAPVALRKMLEAGGPRQLLGEVSEAVIAALNGQMPLVLSVPAPRAWMAAANALAGNADLEIDDDSIEDAAMYMADLMRAVSTVPVSGLLLEEGSQGADLALYRPVLNVARHYRWTTVLRPAPGAIVPAEQLQDVDAVIVQAPSRVSGKMAGIDVGNGLWSGSEPPKRHSGEFYFADIPPGLKPEAVLEGLALLRR